MLCRRAHVLLGLREILFISDLVIGARTTVTSASALGVWFPYLRLTPAFRRWLQYSRKVGISAYGPLRAPWLSL